MTLLKFIITGMHCKSCKMLIEDVLEDLNCKIISFEVDEQKQEGTLQIESEVDAQKIITDIQAEGDYKVQLIK